MVTTMLTKSKKAILMYPGDGSVYITSVVFMKMLIEGKAKGNMMVWKQLKGADDRGMGELEFKKKRSEKGFDFDRIGDDKE